MADRAVSPVLGVVCLLAVTVGIGVVAVTALSGAAPTPSTPPTAASFGLSADPSGTVAVVHRGGDRIDPATIDLRVQVDDEPLDSQPPVPFFSARGFESGPTGVFNSATTGHWRAGETASFRIAGTNSPTVNPGDTVTVELYVEGQSAARLETTV